MLQMMGMSIIKLFVVLKGVLINSMHGVYAPKITNVSVGKLKGTSKNLATSSNLCFSPLASLNKMGNSAAITHSITPCYEQKSTSLGSHEVFRGALNNSGAITCACRLGVENFESHIHSSRVNQHLLKQH